MSYILGKKTNIQNWPSFRYMFQLIFWIKKQVFITSIQSVKAQLHIPLYILDGIIDISY